MSVCLHGDHRLLLVLRGQDDFVFTHLLDSVREAENGDLTADTEPAGRRPRTAVSKWDNSTGATPSTRHGVHHEAHPP